jgi:hypothetical protein
MVMEFSTHEQLLAAGGKRGLLMVWDLNKDGAPMS